MNIFYSTLKDKAVLIALLATGVVTLGLITTQHHSKPIPILTAADKTKIATQFLRMPLSFEANQGQVAEQIKYTTHGAGYNLAFTPQEIIFVSGKQNIHAQFVGANTDTSISATDALPGKSNYFIGNDPKKWRTNVTNYGRINYKNLYPGIDATFYGNQRQLEYDIQVAPQADPNSFKLNFQGAKNIKVDSHGDLIISAANSQSLGMHKPVIYQIVHGVKHNIPGNFTLLANNQVGFKVGNYDKTKQLIIDPILYYSTYLGGSGTSVTSTGYGIAVDSSGNAYVTGSTDSTKFLVTSGAYDTSHNGGIDAFISKFDPDGQTLIYSTFLGGTGTDQGNGIAVDSSGNAYVTGYTTSTGDTTGFPCVNSYQSSNVDNEAAFITKLSSDGASLSYSTYLRSNTTSSAYNSHGQGIAVDSSGNAYITGYTNSSSFPTANAYQTTKGQATNYVAFVTKYPSAGGTTLTYSTYLRPKGACDGILCGNTVNTYGYGIAIDSSNKAYVTGYTTAYAYNNVFGENDNQFPTTTYAYQKTNGSGQSTAGEDAFITKFNATGSGLDYSSYLGGTNSERGLGIAVSATNNAYITGYTLSSAFPTKSPYQTSLKGTQDAFVAKFDPAATSIANSLTYSTYLGGDGIDIGRGIDVTPNDQAFVVGDTTSATGFPTFTPDAFQTTLMGTQDAFLIRLNTGGSALLYSSYLGGGGGTSSNTYGNAVAVISTTGAYITGSTQSKAFPTTANAVNNSLSTGTGITDAFAAAFKTSPTISWAKKTLTYNSNQYDVFDVLAVNDTDCGFSGRCVWTNARSTLSAQYATTYVGQNAAPSSWLQCQQQTISAGRFGINKEVPSTANPDVYYPTSSANRKVSHNSPGPVTTCNLSTVGNADDTVAFLKTSATTMYYIKYNQATPANDQVMVSQDNGSSWAPVNPKGTGTDLRIRYIDGNDDGKVVHIATNYGLYTCSGANYPACSTWSQPTLPSGLTGLNRLAHAYIPQQNYANSQSVAARSLLVIGGDGTQTSASSLYGRLNNGTWFNAGGTGSPPANAVITGITIDNRYIYVSWYSLTAGSAQLLPATLMANSCNYGAQGNLAGDVPNAGVSVGKVYIRGGSASVTWLSTYSGGITNFYSNSLLTLSQVFSNDGSKRASHIYVPSLGEHCNEGGYSVGTISSPSP